MISAQNEMRRKTHVHAENIITDPDILPLVMHREKGVNDLRDYEHATLGMLPSRLMSSLAHGNMCPK